MDIVGSPHASAEGASTSESMWRSVAVFVKELHCRICFYRAKIEACRENRNPERELNFVLRTTASTRVHLVAVLAATRVSSCLAAVSLSQPSQQQCAMAGAELVRLRKVLRDADCADDRKVDILRALRRGEPSVSRELLQVLPRARSSPSLPANTFPWPRAVALIRTF